MPDTGTIIAYRSSGGFGAFRCWRWFPRYEISPYYDSLLVKLSTHAISFKQAKEEKMVRSLRRWPLVVLNNIPFLINVMKNKKFTSGDYTTKFIEETPELFYIQPSLDRGTKTLEYIGNVTINGFPSVEKRPKPDYELASIPTVSSSKIASFSGTKRLLMK
ncbi:hypothetical protein ACVNP1_12630 [Staphylococcus aureus]